jgi:hypothetical protein
MSKDTTDAPAPYTLQYYLEMVILEDVPEGTRLNAAEVYRRMATATDDQLARAGARLGRAKMAVSELGAYEAWAGQQ